MSVNEEKNLGDAVVDRETEPGQSLALDIEIAERVMGWAVMPYGEHQGDHAWFDDKKNYPHITRTKDDRLLVWRWPASLNDGSEWHPSTDIRAAMEVVERIGFEANDFMKSMNMSAFSIHRYPDGQWLVHFSGKGKAYAETLSEAICRAALAAVTNEGSGYQMLANKRR